ncbi:MAG: hypothetical protein ACXW2C_00100 [Acidimicrobiia bacterium]
MSLERPENRHGRTAVLVLVAAILVATALAIALVAGAASQSSEKSDDVLAPGGRVTNGTPANDTPGDDTTTIRPATARQLVASAPTTAEVPTDVMATISSWPRSRCRSSNSTPRCTRV